MTVLHYHDACDVCWFCPCWGERTHMMSFCSHDQAPDYTVWSVGLAYCTVFLRNLHLSWYLPCPSTEGWPGWVHIHSCLGMRDNLTAWIMKKCSEVTQTLRVGCSKAEPKNFAPPHTPFQGARDGQNLFTWRWSLPSPTDPLWWSMHTIASCCGNRPTNKQTHRQGWLQYTVPRLAFSLMMIIIFLLHCSHRT